MDFISKILLYQDIDQIYETIITHVYLKLFWIQ